LAIQPSKSRTLATPLFSLHAALINGNERVATTGAVGPGGSLEALLARHTDAVHVLRENVRQADLEERAALTQLRAGNVEQAVNWYARNERITTATKPSTASWPRGPPMSRLTGTRRCWLGAARTSPLSTPGHGTP
jgi:hypothetical protein